MAKRLNEQKELTMCNSDSAPNRGCRRLAANLRRAGDHAGADLWTRNADRIASWAAIPADSVLRMTEKEAMAWAMSVR